MIDHVLVSPPEMVASRTDELRAATEKKYEDVAREQFGELSEFLKAYTVRQPARALGVAFGLGIFLGWMIRRR